MCDKHGDKDAKGEHDMQTLLLQSLPIFPASFSAPWTGTFENYPKIYVLHWMLLLRHFAICILVILNILPFCS